MAGHSSLAVGLGLSVDRKLSLAHFSASSSYNLLAVSFFLFLSVIRHNIWTYDTSTLTSVVPTSPGERGRSKQTNGIPNYHALLGSLFGGETFESISCWCSGCASRWRPEHWLNMGSSTHYLCDFWAKSIATGYFELKCRREISFLPPTLHWCLLTTVPFDIDRHIVISLTLTKSNQLWRALSGYDLTVQMNVCVEFSWTGKTSLAYYWSGIQVRTRLHTIA
jgi:hypothetical protein